MPTTELQTECFREPQVNSFLCNRLGEDARQGFLAHLATCKHCAALLRDLREDDRLARIPLTAEERGQIRAIVGGARREVAARLTRDRDAREDQEPAVPAPRFDPPGFRLLAGGRQRIFWLSVAVALALAALFAVVRLAGGVSGLEVN